MTVIWVLLLTSACTGACIYLYLIVRAQNWRRLLDSARGLACDMPGQSGISVLCSGIADPDRIERLLATDYAHFEVIVVLDAARYPAEFAALVTRYRMIRVEQPASGELPLRGVFSLGRSRLRRFRRLVLMNRRQDTEAGDLDAAACVAAYDHVLPLRPGQQLRAGAVERLAEALGEYPDNGPALIRSWPGVPTALFCREAVIAAGGFGAHPARRIPWQRRVTLWEPLADRPGQARRQAWIVAAVPAVVAATACAAATGHWPLTAVLLTGLVVWAALHGAWQRTRP